MNEPNTVALQGDGILAGHIARRLSGSYVVHHETTIGATPRQEAATISALILVSDYPDIERFVQVATQCRAAGMAMLPVWAEFGEVRIGPGTSGATTPGCLQCSEIRRMNNHPFSVYHQKILQKAAVSAVPDPALFPQGAALAASLVAVELERLLGACPAAGGEAVFLKLNNLAVSRRSFVPVRACELCGGLAESAPAPADFDFSAEPGKAAGAWRSKDFVGQLGRLEELYVDQKFGLLTTLGIDLTNPLNAIAAGRFRIGHHHVEEWTGGLTTNFAKSKCVAILEGLERYAGLRSRRTRSAAFASYQELSGRALDPERLVLHAPALYALEGYPCRPYRPDMQMSWVWGYSFAEKRPILVPEQLVYYELDQYPAATRFVVETSNGCATGGSLAEAVFHGLLEVLERDAVLQAWYTMRTPPQVDLTNIADPKLRSYIDRIRIRTGCELFCLDVTQEFNIPAFWLMLVNPGNDGPKTLSGSKCHPDPRLAIEGALAELSSAVHFNHHQYVQKRELLLGMLECDANVEDRFDHSLLAGLPEAFHHYAFLLASDAPPAGLDRPEWNETAGWKGNIPRATNEAIRRVLDAGFDVIAVDQTTDEQALVGLHTAKVIVPGLLAFNIGHRFRRTHASKRLPDAGLLNRHPHPFP